MKSWKTTLMGILTALFIICGESYKEFDNDPLTSANIPLIAGTITTAMGFIVAQDYKKK